MTIDAKTPTARALNCQFPLTQLVEAARSGDDEAWRQIVARFNRLVAHRARGFRLGPADEADVIQATWIRLFERLPGLRQPERLGAWLATTARNEALRVLRKRKRRGEVPDEGEAAVSPGPAPDSDFLAAEQRRDLRQAIAALPAAGGALMELLLADPPLSYEEIGTMLDMPVGSIGPTRARCIAALRQSRELVA